MTLPFRRRHNDAEASHDRARADMSDDFTGVLDGAEAAWLEEHLGRCPECRAERDAFLADRALLRSLRDRAPEPPRDLWARTAAAIEAEARQGRGRLGLGQILPPPGPRRIPLGILASALVVLVVVGTALLPRGVPFVLPSSPPGSEVARASEPVATPLVPEANRVAWVQRSADGTFSLVFANVDHACPHADPTCAPLADSSPAPLALAAPPVAVVLSPHSDQLAVIGADAETAGSVLIVDLSTPAPAPSAEATPASTAQPETATPAATVAVTPAGSPSPAHGAARAIISGVTVVGTVGYSADGQWLAFSARPKGGSAGPDLYLWHVGDAGARQVTSDGETFFAGWYGNLVLASGIVLQPVPPEGSPAPASSSETSAEGTAATAAATAAPATSAAPASSEAPGGGAPATPGSPASSPTSQPVEAHPYSFLLDASTGVRTPFALPDVWLPSIDPTGRFVTYWSGTVTPTDPASDGTFVVGQVKSWRPASGRLVLDGWTAPLAPVATPEPSGEPATSAPSPGEAGGVPTNGRLSTPTSAPSEEPVESADPSASTSPPVGPIGTPIELAPAPIAEFDAHFDPRGTRLAIWILDAPEASAGRLWLVVLDPVAGAVNPSLQPMAAPGVQALRGYTIDTGRLAWATPAGQDGQQSSVQVLAWKGDNFGQVQSVPGGNPQIVR
ncbi:MAG TPA: zf-HC2 domain-containing protein [Candidatus Limnocylindrales bacterium]|nr:zf-HC2 domain-containing protein [Candidatus Limnocylindrales bacterium]